MEKERRRLAQGLETKLKRKCLAAPAAGAQNFCKGASFATTFGGLYCAMLPVPYCK